MTTWLERSTPPEQATARPAATADHAAPRGGASSRSKRQVNDDVADAATAHASVLTTCPDTGDPRTSGRKSATVAG
jgi:hypothetical protein